jgi:Tol biopolymer transport system component
LALLIIGLAALLLAPVGPGRASFSGTTGQIAVSEGSTGVGIDTLDPDGTNSRRIWTQTTQEPCGPCAFSEESNPSWSPDGKRIVFEESVEIEIMPVAQGIAIVNADGTGFHWLVQNAPSAHDTHPHWSPDGTNVVFERTNGTLAIVPASGGAITLLTNGHHPDWAPDGTKIAFSSGGEIHVINPNGTGEAPLTAGDDDAYPSWSPNTGRLVFVRHGRLWTMNADGTNQTQMLDVPGASSPAWSPSGDKIVYAVSGTFVLDLATGTNVRISNGVQPDWGTHPIIGLPPPPPPPILPAPVKCVVPRTVGKSLATARRKLVASHCRVGKVGYRHSRLKRGFVYWQSRSAGTRLARGTKIRLLVSLGR